MANFVRKIVSGGKSRFKDKSLDIELDLVYVTDNIIIMGFPATGVEGFYRNKREDAKKFLDHRHGKNYWVYNFCPIRENSYPASFFEGRVSRYPFPDHHAPPLAILPLFVRECREYLSGSPDRVAVLHCKAGKGRSGTLACSYLLSLEETPSPPKLERSMTAKEWAKRRADQVMNAVETAEMTEGEKESEERRIISEKNPTPPPDETNLKSTLENQPEMPSITGQPASMTPLNLTPRTGTLMEQSNLQTRPNSLEGVLALHTARRMRTPSDPEKMKQGVSIPSQRRWLYYWSLILSGAAPPGFWALGEVKNPPIPRVRLREIKVRLKEMGGVKMNLLKVASTIIERTNAGKFGPAAKGSGPVWISLARYKDDFVERLEKWEKHTRDENVGRRRAGSEHMDGAEVSHLFKAGDWDTGKMVRSFARLGHVESASGIQSKVKEDGIVTHVLRPLSEQKLEILKEQIADPSAENAKKLDSETKEAISTTVDGEGSAPLLSNLSSVTDFAEAMDSGNVETGVILDATREVRAKLYIGQVFMGWIWFIPIFHRSSDDMTSTTPLTFTLSRKEVDFAIGPGTAIVDVQISMEWVEPAKTRDGQRRGKEPQPPKTQTSADSEKGIGGEPGTGDGDVAGKVVAGLEAAFGGATGREAVEVIESEDQ